MNFDLDPMLGEKEHSGNSYWLVHTALSSSLDLTVILQEMTCFQFNFIPPPILPYLDSSY